MVRADENAAPNQGTNAIASFTGTVGWEFTHAGPHYWIYVTKLGVYDADGDGMARPHRVGLWTISGSFLGSASVAEGERASLDRGFRFVSIEPIALMPGHYVIGGQFSAGDADLLRFGPSWGLGPELYFPAQDYKVGRYTMSEDLSFPDLESGAPACEGCGAVVPWVVSFQYTLDPPEVRPRLSAVSSGLGQIELRWPTNARGFAVEFIADLRDTAWTVAAGEPVVTGEEYSLTIDAAAGQRFFRLRKTEALANAK